MSSCLALCAVCAFGSVEITRDWQIAVPDGDDPVAWVLKYAGAEVQADLEEALGFKLPVVSHEKARSPAIWIGERPAVKAGFDLAPFSMWDNAYAVTNGNVYLFGRDKGRRNAYAPEWHRTTFPSFRAAARFLEDQVGVRFLMPGRVGTEVPRLKGLTLEEGTRVFEHPTQDYGSASGKPSQLGYMMGNGLYPGGSYAGYGGHSYAHACPASLGKKHPEYFGLVAGQRSIPAVEGPLCISNPEVQQLMVDELVRQFDAGADVCQLGQQDGFRGCECAPCAAYGGEAAKGDWGEKLWLLHADLARRLQKLRPGKMVHILSYGPTVHPPKSFRVFPGNVMIEKCSYTEAAFREWDGYTVPGGFTAYVYLWGEYKLPGFTAKFSCKQAAETARRLLKNKVHGIYRCGYGELFGTEGPCYYVFNRVLVNPRADEHALFDEYCARAYGPAADAMRAFHALQDERLAAFDGTFPKRGQEFFPKAYPQEVLDRMEGMLSAAEKTAGLSAKNRKRLELVRREFAVLVDLAAIARLDVAYRAKRSDATFAPLADAIRRRNAMIDGLYSADGGKNVRGIDGWPELRVFGEVQGMGRSFPKEMFRQNGRLSAALGSPYIWDVDALQRHGVLPGLVKQSLRIRKASERPSADDFETGAWAGVPWNEIAGLELQPISRRARFKASYDDGALYVAMESDLDDSIPSRNHGRDGRVQSDEAAYLMFRPDPGKAAYYQLVWNPADGSFSDRAYGLIEDPLHPEYRRLGTSWNAEGWQIVNRRADGRWRSMVTIPFASVSASCPRPGGSWTVNVGREWNAWTGDPPQFIRALWSPDVESRGFGNPDVMGRLVFE